MTKIHLGDYITSPALGTIIKEMEMILSTKGKEKAYEKVKEVVHALAAIIETWDSPQLILQALESYHLNRAQDAAYRDEQTYDRHQNIAAHLLQVIHVKFPEPALPPFKAWWQDRELMIVEPGQPIGMPSHLATFEDVTAADKRNPTFTKLTADSS